MFHGRMIAKYLHSNTAHLMTTALSVAFVTASAPARAADIPGSKDPSYFKRFEGSEIISYVTSPYDQYQLARGGGTPGAGTTGWGFEKSEMVEGAITRIIYHVPQGHSALEVLRNYERMIADAGFTQTFELAPCGNLAWSGYFVNRFYYQGQPTTDANNPRPFSEATNECYFTAKGSRDGQNLSVAVFVDESSGGNWRRGNMPKAVAFKPGEILIGVDIVAAKSVENKMVVVKAEDMAKALDQTGKVDVYGILFDVDKTAVKPESKQTLDEVAKLLKANPTLKLEISGHTDNTGTAGHNMTLSAGRASAVVQALVKDYGIAATRLQAKGYGDAKPVAPNDSDANKAKNRRVELRRL